MSKIIKSVLFERNAVVVIKPKPMPVPEPVHVHEPEPKVQVPEIDLEAIRAEAETIIANAQSAAAQCMTEAEKNHKKWRSRLMTRLIAKAVRTDLIKAFRKALNRVTKRR